MELTIINREGKAVDEVGVMATLERKMQQLRVAGQAGANQPAYNVCT